MRQPDKYEQLEDTPHAIERERAWYCFYMNGGRFEVALYFGRKIIISKQWCAPGLAHAPVVPSGSKEAIDRREE